METPTLVEDSPALAAGAAKLKVLFQAVTVGLLGLLVVSIVAAIAGETARELLGSLSGFVKLSMQMVGMAVGTSITALSFLSVTGREPDFIDFGKPSRADLKVAVGGLLAVVLAYVLVVALFKLLGVQAHEHSVESTLASGGIAVYGLMVVASWVVIAPSEEVLYRNIVQKSLYDEFSKRSAVLLSSVLFATVHIFAYGGLSSGPSVVLVGILSVLLGGAYAMTEKLIVPILIHGTYNAIQFMLLYVEYQGGL